MAVLLKQDVALAELAAVVESDPALTTAVIRAANSASSAPIDRVNSAGSGIIRLGISGVRRIVVSMILRQHFDSTTDSPFDFDELWRYLLATGILADAAVWQNGGDETRRAMAFTAGVLHKIGRLAYAAEAADDYTRAIDLVRSGRPELEAERDVLGVDHVDHVDYGIKLGGQWRIPEEILRAIAGPYGDDETELGLAMYRGRSIALALGYSDGLSESLDPGNPDIERSLDPDDDALVAHVGGVSQLSERIDWYRGALPGRTNPGNTPATLPS